VDAFKANTWRQLSDAERIKYCRAAAREADALRKSARPEMRQFYRDLAAQWRSLADEIERQLG